MKIKNQDREHAAFPSPHLPREEADAARSRLLSFFRWTRPVGQVGPVS